jgi:O-antigen/teichoic acid export membrane protein
MRARAQDARALAVGSLLNGLLAYVFFVLATRTLGATGAAPVALLWTYWSFASAALTFPLQHWIARSAAAHGREGPVGDALPRVGLVVVVVATSAGVVAWFARDALFHRGDPAFPLLIAVVTVGSGFIGVVRGGLAARGRFGSLAAALAGENALRCLSAVAIILLGAEDAIGFGLCMAVGPLVGLAWPSSFRFAAEGADRAVESAAAFLGPAAGGQLIGQAVLTGGPVLLASTGGTAGDVTALFAALALFRAPYTIAIGLMSQVTGVMTRLVAARDHQTLRRVRTAMVVGAAAVTALAAVTGAVVAPYLLPRIFGNEVRIDSGPSTLVAVGSAMALANLVATVSLMAHGRSGAIAVAWVIAVPLGVVAFMAAPGGALSDTCWAFAVSEGTAFAAMVVSNSVASPAGTHWSEA